MNFYALVRNGALVAPDAPFETSNAITTFWPDEPTDGSEWLPVVEEPGRGKPIYRLQGDVVIRSYRADA
jgi:hypothetical protein